MRTELVDRYYVFNIYVGDKDVKQRWQVFAAQLGKSLSEMVRYSVELAIEAHEEDIRKLRNRHKKDATRS